MNSTDNEKINFGLLESHVDELVKLVEQLKSENATLSDEKSRLLAERGALFEKTELAKTKIESMIIRLKTLEADI